MCPSSSGGLAALFDSPALRARLEAVGEVQIADDVPDDAELTARVCSADAVLLSIHLPDDALRAAAGRLRLAAFTGTGAASYVSLPLAKELGVTVTNVVGYGDRAVAEHTLALLLAAARHVTAGDRAVRAGDWSGWPGLELAGATIAVIGFGGIGRTVARLAAALDMRVLVCDRSVDAAAAAQVQGEVVSMGEAFARADVVSLHLPLNEQTRGIVTTGLLENLRPGSILVNTARGELIERGALAARLARGDVRAALDVFDPEPLPSDDPLLSASHTVLTPHLGFRTPQALQRMAEGAVTCVEAFYAGRPVNVLT